MKNMKTLVASAAIVAVAGFAVSAKDYSEETRDVAAFTEISLKGSMDADVTVGKERSVRVIADDNIISKVITEVRGGTLYLEMEKGSYRNIEKLEVIITVPSLEGVGLYGSGDMNIDGAKSDDFDFDLKGAGDAVFTDSEFGQFDIDLAGSGDVVVDGTCSDIVIDLKGSGDIETNDLKCENADIDVKGSGDIKVHASNSVSISVRGSGDVSVYGKPEKVSSNVRGSGDVNIK